MALAAFIATGLMSGVAAGLLGVGGGLIIVPALIFSLPLLGSDYAPPATYIVHVAVGTSLAVIVFTAIASTRAHHRRNGVLWPVWRAATPGLLIGALLGAALADAMSGDLLRRLFGGFELLIALELAFGKEPDAHRSLPGRWTLFGAGTLIGTVSSVLGIGGGTLSVPMLRWCRVSIREAIGTAAAMGIPIALAGAIGFLMNGIGEATGGAQIGYLSWPAMMAIAGASLFTAPIGTRLAYLLPEKVLRRVFAGFLALVAIRLMSI
ncbi:MAG: sulfite exporter TauE/SafE family protein [Gammaproteobacteria bacterium]|nr:sulfite exporter TauE/SafE family protein [Gammaproteobacteria bacterium]MCP5138195.1 sulfite exporter TauE/SafE family protein [Gammaproteobacteria bacterium]